MIPKANQNEMPPKLILEIKMLYQKPSDIYIHVLHSVIYDHTSYSFSHRIQYLWEWELELCNFFETNWYFHLSAPNIHVGKICPACRFTGKPWRTCFELNGKLSFFIFLFVCLFVFFLLLFLFYFVVVFCFLLFCFLLVLFSFFIYLFIYVCIYLFIYLFIYLLFFC